MTRGHILIAIANSICYLLAAALKASDLSRLGQGFIQAGFAHARSRWKWTGHQRLNHTLRRSHITSSPKPVNYSYVDTVYD
jgi:hypothetical protein